jgi:hypothetical protein
VQAAPLGAVAQGPGPAGVGKNRLRVQAPPGPRPHQCFIRSLPGRGCDPGRRPVPTGSAAPAGAAGAGGPGPARRGRGRPAPTLTRVWSRAGRSGQRLVQAPGNNAKRYGFGLVDWRDGRPSPRQPGTRAPDRALGGRPQVIGMKR